MAKHTIISIVLILLCRLVHGTRTNLFSLESLDILPALPPTAGDDICSTLVEKHGYACEEHKVTTQDGFILCMQRISEGQSGGTPGNKPPVLLQHGLQMDAAVWLLLEQSLAFVLADNGFDVWLANSRGTTSSSGHTSLSPKDKTFWDWSWDELVAYDLPSMLNYVYNQTGQHLHYVGYSQGTLVALAALSKGLASNMLRSAALLSPIAYVGQMTSPIARTAANIILANVSYWLDIAEFNQLGPAGIELLIEICSTPGIDCSQILTLFTGPNCCLNTSALATFISHGPQSTSTKNTIHISQMIKNGTLTMYNYNNEDENRKHYGQPTPPEYDMTKIPNDVPLFLGHGGADALSVVKDVQLLLESLKGHVKEKLVVQYIENYAHADFVMGTNAKQVLYDPLIAFLKLQ